MPLLSRILPLLSRRTSGRDLIPEIDGLRSIAIMSVVFFHAAGYFAGATKHGTDGAALDAFLIRLLGVFDYGVPLFFVISGFILALPFAAHHLRGEKRPTLKNYFLRRLTRLEPPYIVALTALLLLKLSGLVSVPGTEAGNAAPAELFKHYAASLFYIHNIIYHEQSTVLGLAWSLEIEVQFYILAPLLTTIFILRSAAARRILLAGAMIATAHFFGVAHPPDGLSILNHAPYFLAGMFLADLYLCGLDLGWTNSVRPSAWGFVALIALCACFLAPAYGIAPALCVPWLALLAFASVFRARGGIVRGFFRARPVVILGGMCYSIYLWHSTIIGAARPFLLRITGTDPDWPTRLSFILLAAIPAVLISAVFFILIERPTMVPHWPRKLWEAIARQK